MQALSCCIYYIGYDLNINYQKRFKKKKKTQKFINENILLGNSYYTMQRLFIYFLH
jgi:hypothetical protein